MKNRPLTTAFLVTILCLAFLSKASAEGNEKHPNLPQLSVRGEALLQVPADQLHLNIGVVSDAATSEEALEKNTAAMKKIVKAIEKTGLSKDEYKTRQFQIQPRWSSRPKQAPPDWRPKIIGYSVTNSLAIKTQKLNLAGTLIGGASEAGANEINGITFDLSDPRRYRDDAIQAATKNAIADARSLAEAASVKLKRVLSLNLDNTSAAPVRHYAESLQTMRVQSMDTATPPIESGDVTVRANVSVIFEIDQ